MATTKKPAVKAVEKAADKAVNGTEATVDTVEKLGDIAEKNLDTLLEGNNKFVPWMKRGPMAVVFVVCVGVAAGAGVTYFVTKKRLSKQYEARLTAEIIAAREHYGKLYKTDKEHSSPEVVVERLHPEAAESLKEYQGEGSAPVPPVETLSKKQRRRKERESREVQVVPETSPIAVPDFDYAAAVASRTPEKPYIITREEYYQNSDDDDQISLTYFEQDDTAVDERDAPLPDHEDTLGDEFMVLFGHGSGDPNIVYIRNEKINCVFEIVRNTGSYGKEVLGFTPDVQDEIKHAASQARRQRTRKSRKSDEE